MIESNGSINHWGYFLALEDDLARIFRYIDPSQGNFGTYSLELARTMLATCSEIDVVLKAACNVINERKGCEPLDRKAANIRRYRQILAENSTFPFADAEASIPIYGLASKPWDNWGKLEAKEQDMVPDWWGAYNRVKHHRSERYAEANLSNAFNALGALFLVEIFYHKLLGRKELSPSPQYFRTNPNIAATNIRAVDGAPVMVIDGDRLELWCRKQNSNVG